MNVTSQRKVVVSVTSHNFTYLSNPWNNFSVTSSNRNCRGYLCRSLIISPYITASSTWMHPTNQPFICGSTTLDMAGLQIQYQSLCLPSDIELFSSFCERLGQWIWETAKIVAKFQRILNPEIEDNISFVLLPHIFASISRWSSKHSMSGIWKRIR